MRDHNRFLRLGLLTLVGLAAAVWGCQGPDPFLRANFDGSGGAIEEGTGGARGTGGMGTGGKLGGTGGSAPGLGGSVGSGGKLAGAGGAIPGSGGRIGTGGVVVTGTGGVVAGTGGVVVTGTGGTDAGAGDAADDTGGNAGTGGAQMPPCTDCLEVQIECKASATSQEFKFWFQLVNKTTMPIAYSGITVRYWYKADLPNEVLTFTLDQAAKLAGQVRGAFGTAGANQYVEVSFATGAGTLASGANSGEIQIRINAHTPGWNATQADDYSFMGCPTASTFMTWDHVTAYMGGALVWGTAPPP